MEWGEKNARSDLSDNNGQYKEWVCQICFRSVQMFGFNPNFLNVWSLTPSKCPLGIEGLICLAHVHSQIWSRSVQWFGRFPRYMNWWPPNPHARRVSRGYFFSSCPFLYEYAYVCKIWSRFVQLFVIFPTFLNVWPPDHLTPSKCPLGLEGLIFY